MIHLFHFLKSIAFSPDMRKPIEATFQLSEVQTKGICEAIKGVIEYDVEEIENEEIIIEIVSDDEVPD